MTLSLQRLLERNILPNAHQTDANHWRQLLQRPDIRHVLTKFVSRRPYNSFTAHRWLCRFSHRLQAQYRHFAKADGGVLNLAEFSNLLRVSGSDVARAVL